MGFDLTILSLPEEYRDSTYVPMVDGSPDHFRLSTAEMNVVTLAMERAGVLDGGCPIPSLWPIEGLSAERYEEILAFRHGAQGLVPPTVQEMQAAQKAMHVLSSLPAPRSSNAGKVPTFKFAYADGWIVVPEECQVIHQGLAQLLARPRGFLNFLSSSRAFRDGKEENLVKRFASFNRVAAKHGGYRVS
jgi:hypothetical protein